MSRSDEIKNINNIESRNSYRKNGLDAQKVNLGSFFKDSSAFGVGDCLIRNVYFTDLENFELKQITGSECVCLKICIEIINPVENIIIGFYVKDRLGQFHFGDNTYAECEVLKRKFKPDNDVVVDFKFIMPRLTNGDYMVSAAIATGTQDDHVQQHWINDALAFSSISNCHSGGLIGIPMNEIKVCVNE